MQILIITCWQGHISINWIGDGIQNCCNYCNFPANCRVGGEYFTSNKWKTVFRLKLVYSVWDFFFTSPVQWVAGRAGLRGGSVPPWCHSPAPSAPRQQLPALGWGSEPAEILLSLFWLPCYPFCLFIDHTIAPLPARERLARSGPAGKVIFIWSPSFPMHKHSLYFACRGGCVCVKFNLPI